MNVALFVTCLGDTFYPRTAIAVVKVLERLGCTVHFPQQQTCCGQPMWNTGYTHETRQLAEQLIDTFEPYDTIITPSGSCAAMVRDYYPEMFDKEEPYHAKAETFASRLWEFGEFLVNGLMVDLRDYDVRWEGAATYHYSCHLRGIGITNEAVRLIEQIEGLEFTPLEKSEQCCGFGGTFALKYPQMSGSMARDKVQCVQRTGARTLISNDAGCTMNIAGMMHREQMDVEVKSLPEIIAEGMGLMDRDTPAQTPTA
jgi:L-lactate dehydrogenase complex protein LldE